MISYVSDEFAHKESMQNGGLLTAGTSATFGASMQLSALPSCQPSARQRTPVESLCHYQKAMLDWGFVMDRQSGALLKINPCKRARGQYLYSVDVRCARPGSLAANSFGSLQTEHRI